MVEYQFECNYCGKTWKKKFYNIPDIADLKCPDCKDSNIRKLKLAKDSKYGYNVPKIFKKDDKD